MYQHCISTSYFDSNLMPAPGTGREKSVTKRPNQTQFGYIRLGQFETNDGKRPLLN